MKTLNAELEVDRIGVQRALTQREEDIICEYFKNKKQSRSRQPAPTKRSGYSPFNSTWKLSRLMNPAPSKK